MTATDPLVQPEPAPRDAALLSAENITRRFGGLVAVSNFSFAARQGEILGLIGPNGAGKSTLFNVISGFYRPSAGRLWFNGEDITGKSAMYISRKGLVRTFQHDSFLRDMTVAENILIGTVHKNRLPSDRERLVHETAELVGLSAYLGEVAGSLPHGLQRLLSVAIAVAARPLLICLDEPLTGLNAIEVGAALNLFRRIRDEYGATILLVEHNMRAVMQICDRIIVLHYGEWLAEGTPAEISRNAQVIEAYLGMKS
jgi:branched-chain amino acid transport system ATP-binding protein